MNFTKRFWVHVVICVVLAFLTFIFGALSDWAEIQHQIAAANKYTTSTLKIISFFAAFASIVGAGFAGYAAYDEWNESNKGIDF